MQRMRREKMPTGEERADGQMDTNTTSHDETGDVE